MLEHLTVHQKNRLAAIRESTGNLTPEAIVNDARLGGPLNSLFNWDDRDAADKFRIQQAREVIRVSVRILPQKNQETQRVRVAEVATPKPADFSPKPTTQPDPGRFKTGRAGPRVKMGNPGAITAEQRDSAHEAIRDFRFKFRNLEGDPAFGCVFLAIQEAEEHLETENYGETVPKQFTSKAHK